MGNKDDRTFLWGLLDDIDTANDMAKDSDAVFRVLVNRLHPRRFERATSDGYNLTWLSAPAEATERPAQDADRIYDACMPVIRENLSERPEVGEARTDPRAVAEALGFDPTNHHNAAVCPYCAPRPDPAAAALREADEIASLRHLAVWRHNESYSLRWPDGDLFVGPFANEAAAEHACKTLRALASLPPQGDAEGREP